MRGFKDASVDTVLIDGNNAQELKATLKEMDERGEAVCQELHKALEKAKDQFRELNEHFKPRIKAAVKGTKLEGLDPEEIGFDVRFLDQHNVAFARKETKSPIEDFLDTLKSAIENGPSPTGDSIFVEEIQPFRTRH